MAGWNRRGSGCEAVWLAGSKGHLAISSENTDWVRTLWQQTEGTARKKSGLRCENKCQHNPPNERCVHLPCAVRYTTWQGLINKSSEELIIPAGAALVWDNKSSKWNGQEIFYPNPYFPPIPSRFKNKKKELGTRAGLPRWKVKYLQKLDRKNKKVGMSCDMEGGMVEVTFRDEAKNSPAFQYERNKGKLQPMPEDKRTHITPN